MLLIVGHFSETKLDLQVDLQFAGGDVPYIMLA